MDVKYDYTVNLGGTEDRSEYDNESYEPLWLDWLAAVVQPKCTEVPNYPHNYHAIPIFVHRIGLPLAIH